MEINFLTDLTFSFTVYYRKENIYMGLDLNFKRRINCLVITVCKTNTSKFKLNRLAIYCTIQQRGYSRLFERDNEGKLEL